MNKQTASLYLILATFAVGIAPAISSAAASTPTAPSSFYCIAFPSTHSVAVPALPGYGTESTLVESRQKAIESCTQRSAFGAGANCKISACYPQ